VSDGRGGETPAVMGVGILPGTVAGKCCRNSGLWTELQGRWFPDGCRKKC
jgi:hypothetical protein